MVTIICFSSGLSGQLSSAVISAMVRDTPKGQTIPVAVQYTLSSSHMVHSQSTVIHSVICLLSNIGVVIGNIYYFLLNMGTQQLVGQCHGLKILKL